MAQVKAYHENEIAKMKEKDKENEAGEDKDEGGNEVPGAREVSRRVPAQNPAKPANSRRPVSKEKEQYTQCHVLFCVFIE